MEYRAVRVVHDYAKTESITVKIDAALRSWGEAGWTLHSQSVTTFVGGVGGIYAANSTHEIVLLIFQKESSRSPTDEAH
jgi:hypothetical protein